MAEIWQIIVQSNTLNFLIVLAVVLFIVFKLDVKSKLEAIKDEIKTYVDTSSQEKEAAEKDLDEIKEKCSPEIIQAKEQAMSAIKGSKEKVEEAYKKFNDYLKAKQLAKAKNNETNVDEM